MGEDLTARETEYEDGNENSAERDEEAEEKTTK
jgi:hypothetical protein